LAGANRSSFLKSSAPLLVFLAAFLYCFWIFASRFVLISDEGNCLSIALRVARGEIPYRDFFVYIGPGYPLIGSLPLRLFGERMWAARLPVLIDLSAMTAVVFWLTVRLARETRAAIFAASIAAFSFLAFLTADASRIGADHRLDASAVAIVAIALTVSLLDDPSRTRAVVVGALAALAAWITPPLALVTLVIVIAARRWFWSVVAGAAACSAIFVTWLSAHGALRPAIDGLLWPTRHYSGANRVPYASVTGGYANLFRASGAGEWMVTILLLTCLTLPATLPFLTTIAWAWRVRVQKEMRGLVLFLVASMAALILSTYPRADLNHLTNVAAICYALAAAWIVITIPKRVAFGIAMGLLILAAADYGLAIQRRVTEPSIQTRVGTLRGSREDLDALQFVTGRVGPSDRFFAYPYLPNFYFITGAKNPTRFSWMQPGMFTTDEELAAKAEMEQSPPDYILYLDVPKSAYLRMWPNTDPARLRLPLMEQFIATRSHVVDRHGPYELRGVSLTR